jgi:hypothetical protein
MENHDRKHPESISQPLQAGTSTSDGEVLHNLIQEVSTLWDEHEPTEINRPFDWNDYLPTFEQLSKDHQNFPNVFYQSNHNNFYRQKFLRDIRPGDRICATVKVNTNNLNYFTLKSR